MEKLKAPKIRVTGSKVTFGSFDIFHAGAKHTVDESDVEFGTSQASYWFYVQVVLFKDTGEYGYHVSEGAPGTGPALSQDTPQIQFLGTVMSGNVSADGATVADYYQHAFPPFLLEVK